MLFGRQGKGIDWKQFVITAGYSQALGTHAIGGQMKALTGNSFDLASFAKHHPAAALFHECSFVIVLPKKTEVIRPPASDGMTQLIRF